jgi:hypothetical protein
VDAQTLKEAAIIFVMAQLGDIITTDAGRR